VVRLNSPVGDAGAIVLPATATQALSKGDEFVRFVLTTGTTVSLSASVPVSIDGGGRPPVSTNVLTVIA